MKVVTIKNNITHLPTVTGQQKWRILELVTRLQTQQVLVGIAEDTDLIEQWLVSRHHVMDHGPAVIIELHKIKFAECGVLGPIFCFVAREARIE